MAHSSEINDETISTEQNEDSNMPSNNSDDLLDRAFLLNNPSFFPNYQQNDISTSEPDYINFGFDKQLSLNDQQSLPSSYVFTASEILSELVVRCVSSMGVQIKSTTLERAVVQVCTDDNDIENQWRKTYLFYQTARNCNDHDRIKEELYQSLHSLINDERDLMIGLDSLSSLKDLLLTSMKICTEPNFQLEIRIGLGGTEDSPTLRTPAYAIAGLDLLERLVRLRTRFSTTIQPSVASAYIPTIMLDKPPVLTVFCAYTAAVQVNKLNQKIAKEHAKAMLSYIKIYINHYHPNLSEHVRYQMDHEDTYDCELLERIIKHYNEDYQDERMKQLFIGQAKKHGGNELSAARYVSMHLIIFKDIVDKNFSDSLFHPLSENENNQSGSLYDCVITIGGPVEQRFNEVRYAVRQFFITESQQNNEQNYQFPLSIRMLSEAGQTPVYYHNKPGEITIEQVLREPINDLKLTHNDYRDIRKDISILKEDIAICALKSIWNRLPHSDSHRITTWKNTMKNLIVLLIKVWRNNAMRNPQDSIENKNTIDGIRQSDPLSDDLDQVGGVIIDEILKALKGTFRADFGKFKTDGGPNSLNLGDKIRDKIINDLNSTLDLILLKFIRNTFRI